MIRRINGKPNIKPYKKAASTAFTRNDVVTLDASGYLVLATSLTPRSELLGLMMREVASTDDDYAENTLVEVDCFEGCGSEDFEADVSTGSATQAMTGLSVDLDDEDSLDVTLTPNKHFRIERVLSTTKVRGSFRVDGESPQLKSIRQTVSYDEFTDGGAAIGTLDLDESIPVGAVVQQTLIDDVTGFAGDTSATIQVGDGTDVDRYSTGTPSVFTTAAAIDAGVPSGTKFHSAAKTPKLTITTNADWTSVSAGALTITIFYFEATA